MVTPVAQPAMGANLVGHTLIAKAIRTQDGNSCWTTVHFFDETPPVIVCHDTIVTCNQPISPANLGIPLITDNCGSAAYLSANLSYSDNISQVGGCGNDFLKIIDRLWEGFDETGNYGTCLQTITIKRPVLDDVYFPDDIDIAACKDNKNNLALTGQPRFIQNYFPITTDILCDLLVSHFDTVASTCGKTDTTWLRTWRVTIPDPCTGSLDTAVFVQMVTMMDTMPPSVVCPTDLTLNLVTDSCYANVMFPTVFGSDLCAGTIQAIPMWQFGTGIGVFPGIPVGIYNAQYMVQDCNNQAFCDLVVTVIDQQTPTILCKGKRTIALGIDGTACLTAQSFVTYAADNCGGTNADLLYKVDRGTGFEEKVTVTCADIGVLILTIHVAEVDNPLNVSECTDTLTIQDKLRPKLICPPNQTISCDNPNLYNLAAFGQPTITDNCGLDTVIYKEQKNVTNCGVGTASRKWIAIDNYGNRDSCTQIITVQNTKPFTAANIKWPKDTTFFGCIASLDPNALTGIYKEPTFSGVFCGMPVFSKTDAVYDNNKPACWKIVRKWKVIDWCTYDPATDSPKYEHFQILAVMDTVKPLLVLPANQTISFGAVCGTGVVTATASATDCSTKLTWQQLLSNGTKNPYATNANTQILSGNYPAGTTTVKVIVSDGCGNESVGLWKVTVKDLKPPTPVCVNGLSVNLTKMSDTTVMAMVNATMFNQSSFDNCTLQKNLKFTIRKHSLGLTTPATDAVLTLDCGDIGTVVVELWVTDECGNSDFCTTYIIVQDNKDFCSSIISKAKISGAIVTDMGEVLENAKVELMNNSTVSTPISTNSTGAFALQNLAINQNYTVHPTKNDDVTNGISTFDLITLQKHIVNVAPFTTPYQYIAADINKNGVVTTADLVELRKLILGVYSEFPQNTSWRFIASGYQFPTSGNPLAVVFPEMKQISLTGAGATADFMGIKIGDLNHDALANNNATNSNVGDRNDDQTPEMLFFLDEKTWKKDEIIEFPLRAKDFKSVDGLQFTLEFDVEKLELDDIFSTNLPNFSTQNIGATRLENGLIAFSWNNPTASKTGFELAENQPIFTVRMRAKQSGTASESLKMSSEITKAMAFIGDKHHKPTLAFIQKNGQIEPPKTTNELLQNQPNPFSDQTAIGFQLTENQAVTLKIYDISGQLIFSETSEAMAGRNEFWVSKSSLNGAGIYVYHLETSTWHATKKLIVE
jgi:hypothetical protein